MKDEANLETSDHHLLQGTKILCKEARDYHCHDLCVYWK